MTSNILECGCWRGGDCTKTTVCAIENAVEEWKDRAEAAEAKLEAARGLPEKWRDRGDCGYQGDLGDGLCSGHERCADELDAALKETKSD